MNNSMDTVCYDDEILISRTLNLFQVEPCPYPAVNVDQNFSSPDKMNVPPPSVQPDDEKISNISQKNYSNPLDKETVSVLYYFIFFTFTEITRTHII